MMKEIGEFAFRVICCAFIGSILNCIIQDTKLREIIKFISALLLTLTILEPITSLDYSEILDLEVSYVDDAVYYQNTGITQTKKILNQRIQDEIEAYILTEAHQIGADLTVEITIGEDSLPQKVFLHGKITPSAKLHLEHFLESTLAIAKENQIWTG